MCAPYKYCNVLFVEYSYGLKTTPITIPKRSDQSVDGQAVNLAYTHGVSRSTYARQRQSVLHSVSGSVPDSG